MLPLPEGVGGRFSVWSAVGLPLALVQGRAYADFLTPASQQIFQDRFPQFMQEGHIKDLEMELLTASGTAMPMCQAPLLRPTITSHHHSAAMLITATALANASRCGA